MGSGCLERILSSSQISSQISAYILLAKVMYATENHMIKFNLHGKELYKGKTSEEQGY